MQLLRMLQIHSTKLLSPLLAFYLNFWLLGRTRKDIDTTQFLCRSCSLNGDENSAVLEILFSNSLSSWARFTGNIVLIIEHRRSMHTYLRCEKSNSVRFSLRCSSLTVSASTLSVYVVRSTTYTEHREQQRRCVTITLHTCKAIFIKGCSDQNLVKQ